MVRRSSNKDLVPVACAYAQSVFRFYDRGFVSFADESDESLNAFPKRVVNLANGRVADLPDVGEHDDASDWLYEMTFHLTPRGLAGDIVTYVKSGTAFFFKVHPDDGLRLCRVKPSCPDCRSTSTCACS